MNKKLRALLMSLVITLGIIVSSSAFAVEMTTTYKVVSGDSLWKISNTFKVTVDQLKKWNRLNDNTIYVGQTLKVAPIHTVQAGESLWIISKMYGATVDNLVKLNNLSSSTIYVGQALKIEGVIQSNPQVVSKVETINHVVKSGDNLWTLTQKYNTTMDAIMRSNMLVFDILMPNQTITIPVNSTEIVKPVGISMMKARENNNFGDIYTWENAMRLWTTETQGMLKDLETGRTFNVKYYGGSNHSDVVPLTQGDTSIIESIFGPWSWAKKRPMILYFEKAGVKYQMAVSLTGMPHSTTDIYDNGMTGHMDLYFYNSVGHTDPVVDSTHQTNILKANGQ